MFGYYCPDLFSIGIIVCQDMEEILTVVEHVGGDWVEVGVEEEGSLKGIQPVGSLRTVNWDRVELKILMRSSTMPPLPAGTWTPGRWSNSGKRLYLIDLYESKPHPFHEALISLDV